MLATLLAAALTQAPVPPALSAPVPSARRICRREVPIGSIMPGKLVCLTKAEWAQVGDTRERNSDGFFRRPTRPLPKGYE